MRTASSRELRGSCRTIGARSRACRDTLWPRIGRLASARLAGSLASRNVNRRNVLTALAAGTLAALTACGTRPGQLLASGQPVRPDRSSVPPGTSLPAAETATPSVSSSAPVVSSSAPPDQRVALPGGPITGLPEGPARVAISIDDGVSSAVVAAFAELLTITGLRMTFFPNAVYRSWADNAPTLGPLVESGQVQLGNHTWSHADLRTLTPTEIAEELQRNDDALRNLYGVTTRPYVRPPYGGRTEHTDRICADLGYPAIAMWSSTFGDHTQISGGEVLEYARASMTAGSIVLGHANYPMVSGVFDRIADLLAERALAAVTFDDVFRADAP